MKPLFRSFSMFVRQIVRDSMLVAICFACVLTALFVRFGVPALEGVLCGYFQKDAILLPYYLLFDLLLILITPYMLCFASAMMMLTEYDENLSGYLAVTPVGKGGYMLSRLLFPSVIAFVASLLLIEYFSLTEWPMFLLLCACVIAELSSVAVALLLFAFSHNRVEGVAMGKLSGLLMLGLFIPFFLSSDVQYLFALLPSFWLSKLCITGRVDLMLPALLSSALWILMLYRRFERKIA